MVQQRPLLALILFSALLANGQALAAGLDEQRAVFLQAEKALERGSTQDFERLRAKIHDYPLYPYLEYQALIGAMDKLKNDPTAKSMSPWKIKDSIQRSLWVSYASNNIKPNNIRISKTTDGIKVRVAYEIREDFLGNIDVIGSFDRTVVLR